MYADDLIQTIVNSIQNDDLDTLRTTPIPVMRETSYYNILDFAINNNNMEAFGILLDRFPVPPAMYMNSEQIEVLRYLLDTYDIDPNLGLRDAIQLFENPETVQLLLEHGADPIQALRLVLQIQDDLDVNDMIDVIQNYATLDDMFDVVVQAGNPMIIELFLDHDVDPRVSREAMLGLLNSSFPESTEMFNMLISQDFEYYHNLGFSVTDHLYTVYPLFEKGIPDDILVQMMINNMGYSHKSAKWLLKKMHNIGRHKN